MTGCLVNIKFHFIHQTYWTCNKKRHTYRIHGERSFWSFRINCTCMGRLVQVLVRSLRLGQWTQLWTRIDQTAFQDGGGYGEEVEEDVKDRALLEMVEELVRRGRRDTTTLVNITVTVHFTHKFRFVAKFLWTMSAHMSISRTFLQAVYSIPTCFYWASYCCSQWGFWKQVDWFRLFFTMENVI